MSEKNVVELRILDTEFNLKAKDDIDHIRLIADYVNTELERIKDANPFTNHIRIAILGCMNITEKLFIAEDQVKNNLEEKIKEMGEISTIKEKLSATEALLGDEKQKTDQIIKEKKELQKEIDEKNELLNQYREHLRQSKIDSETSRKTILDLQNQLFESQIELVKVNKNHIEKDIFKSIEDKIK
jgi:cell division protein ZapA